MTWVIVRTESGKERSVYASIIAMGCEAWLPIEPRFTRASPHTKQHRQWWGCILPTRFFACLSPAAISFLPQIRYCLGVERNGFGNALEASDAEIRGFRASIESENARLLRMSRTERETATAAKRKPKPSRKLRRGKAAQNLEAWYAAKTGVKVIKKAA